MSKILTLPSVLVTREPMIPIVDDLPAPLGPSKAKKSPSSTERFIPFKATAPESYVFFKLVISNAN